MLEQKEIKKIKEATEEFFEKMTAVVSNISVSLSPTEKTDKDQQKPLIENMDTIDLSVESDEPQILIGQGGQTLFEIQRILRAVISRRLKKVLYINFDINDYKKKKVEYLKNLAKDLADQVSLSKEENALMPMPAYERRIIHSALSQRTDITTESRGDGPERHIVIKPI